MLAAPLHDAGVVVGVDARLQPLEDLPPHRRQLIERTPLVCLAAVGHQLFFPYREYPAVALVGRQGAGDLGERTKDLQPLFGHRDPHAPFDVHELLALGLNHSLIRRCYRSLAAALTQRLFQFRKRPHAPHCQGRAVLQNVPIALRQFGRHGRDAFLARETDRTRRLLYLMPQALQKLQALPGLDHAGTLLLGGRIICKHRLLPCLNQLPIDRLAQFGRDPRELLPFLLPANVFVSHADERLQSRGGVAEVAAAV